MLHNVTNALLNFILVSVPEEFFLTAMTLIFLKRFDLLDIRMWRHNLKWLTIPILPIAILINVFRYILIIPKPIATIINLILFYLLILYIVKQNSYIFSNKDYRRILIGLSASFMILSLLEGLTVPMLLYLIHKPLDFIQKNPSWNFLMSIPSRIVEFLIVIFLIIKNNNVVKVKILEVISKNNFLLISTASFAVISNVFVAYIIKLIAIDGILENKLSLLGQMLIVTCVLLFPVVILFWVLLLVNYLLVKEKQIQQTYENLIIQDDFTTDVEN